MAGRRAELPDRALPVPRRCRGSLPAALVIVPTGAGANMNVLKDAASMGGNEDVL